MYDDYMLIKKDKTTMVLVYNSQIITMHLRMLDCYSEHLGSEVVMMALVVDFW